MSGNPEASRKEKNFNVRVMKQEVVAAMLPSQQYCPPLSNLDLLLPPVDVGVFFCYHKPPPPAATSSFVVGALRKSLSEALVSFYPLAGELVISSAGEPELLCNNRGVDFVEAVADVELTGLDLHNPDDSIEGKLVPNRKYGVLAVQATFLRCGGLVVGCTFDHRIADAYSADMFLVAWAQLAQPTTAPLPSQPCFRRSLLSPRRPGRIHPSIHDMYVPFSKLPPPKKPISGSVSETDPLISRIYYITADQLNRIQSLANANNGVKKRTKLESFCAFLWQMVAAGTKDKRVIAKMGIVIDGRKRLVSYDKVGGKERASLLSSYFGNVISVPYGGKTVAELSEKPLSWVADEVHEFLEAATTEEHFPSLIDWVEAHRPGAGLARIYCGGYDGGEGDGGPAIVVSSGQRFVEAKVDFGWGRPVFGSYHFPWGGDAGYVMPMPSPLENGDWVVYMHLRRGQLKNMECDAANAFKPLTWDYLNL